VNEVEYRYDLVIAEGIALRGHFEVVGFPADLDGAVETLEDDGDRSFRISV
jgi:hypothetical protein